MDLENGQRWLLSGPKLGKLETKIVITSLCCEMKFPYISGWKGGMPREDTVDGAKGTVSRAVKVKRATVRLSLG